MQVDAMIPVDGSSTCCGGGEFGWKISSLWLWRAETDNCCEILVKVKEELVAEKLEPTVKLVNGTTGRFSKTTERSCRAKLPDRALY